MESCTCMEHQCLNSWMSSKNAGLMWLTSAPCILNTQSEHLIFKISCQCNQTDNATRVSGLFVSITIKEWEQTIRNWSNLPNESNLQVPIRNISWTIWLTWERWAQPGVGLAAPACAGLNHQKKYDSKQFQGRPGRSGAEAYSGQTWI